MVSGIQDNSTERSCDAKNHLLLTIRPGLPCLQNLLRSAGYKFSKMACRAFSLRAFPSQVRRQKLMFI